MNLDRLLYRLSDHLPCRVISGPHSTPYLERYFLARVGGWRLYLHRFLRSDYDRGLHDHPFGFSAGLILTGGYIEHRLDGFDEDGFRVRVREVRPGRLNVIGRRTFHRVDLAEGETCWSLFVHSPHCKTWGFLRRNWNGGKGAVTFYPARMTVGGRLWWREAPKGRCAEGRAP